MAGTFFKTITSELVWRTVFYTRADAEQAIARYIDGSHSPVRRHSALDYLSPCNLSNNQRIEQTRLHFIGVSPVLTCRRSMQRRRPADRPRE